MMSEEKSNETKPVENKSRPYLPLTLSAGILGLAVGAGLYAFLGGNDNGVDGQGGEKVTTNLEASQCILDEALQAKLSKAASGEVAGFQATDRSYSVASIGFKDVKGQDKTLADWKGRHVLLNLWATWCAPCRAEMPALDELQETLGGETFEVVAVSVDLGAAEKPKAFFKDIKIKHLNFYHDGNLEPLNQLKRDGLAFGLPATLLLDDRGCLLGTLNGPAEWSSKDAVGLIKASF